MSAHVNCPACHQPLHNRTNGVGLAYLECFPCDYIEAVIPKPSPFPDPPPKPYVDWRGHVRLRVRNVIPTGDHRPYKRKGGWA